MRLIRSLHNIRPEMLGGVLTIGNFDGVHLGHQALLREMQSLAKAEKLPTTMITFEPYPSEYFGGKEVNIPRLTRLREKIQILQSTGIDYLLILPFNQKLAVMSPSDFVTTILHQSLAPKHIIIGDDFRFGYKRQGDFSLLKKMGETLNFSVKSLPSILSGGERVSSTRIRSALNQGDLSLASALLGRPYTMSGRISVGDRLGRQLGFPTANIFLHRKLTPLHGIFAVIVYGLDRQEVMGAASLGSRPTVDGTRTLLEVHLLDFNQDIYGRYVTVQFCKKLRPEAYFPNLDLLKEQIAKDVEETKLYFQKVNLLPLK